MKHIALLAAALFVVATPAVSQESESARWTQHARNVTIVRDSWGVPHVYGKTDADAVFGVIYAQAEDDFNRVETNYLISLGRLAEAEGERSIYNDLRYRLINDPRDLEAKYQSVAPWLKTLMQAWADGLNFYLSTHPSVKPKVITRFEPWMPLSFSDGSIGPDIERVNLGHLAAFYPGAAPPSTGGEPPAEYEEPTGSNGIAIGPSITKDHHALLMINPHTSFFFREEAQMVSDEGLNAYGAITWGQFFIYQGFNDRAGWMHTSSGVDNIDEYAETIVKKGSGYVYKYGNEERPVTARTVTIAYRAASGPAQKTFTIYSTHHGPIVRQAGDKWIAIRLMQEPVKAITQSFTRTKVRNYKGFVESMQLHTNSSNNTIYADADGNIAYFHSNFIPKRDPKFDWTKPVDGSDPATEWHDVMSVDETPKLLNPANGWLYNSNNWPWSAAGPNSPKREDFPAYVERGTEESPRGEHALKVLPSRTDYTVDTLIAAAYDSFLPWFADHLPALIKAWDDQPAGSALKTKLADPIAALRKWDYRWSTSSVPTAVAVYWGETIGNRVERASAEDLLNALGTAVDRLARDFGTWQTAWGDINRFQRIDDAITPHGDDTRPSIPVGFTSSRWGSLASFGARRYPNTKKMYGYTGNSFVAAIEFGDRIRARAVTAGGLSGDPASPHFNDQASRYASGDLRDVYFYRDDVNAHAERTYHPGASTERGSGASKR